MQKILRKGGKNTQKNYTGKIFMIQIIMMVCVITHLEPNILECEVKWTLGSITMTKANGGDGIPVELFQIPKIDVVKYASKFGKLSRGHRTGKGSFHSNPKERQCKRMLKLPHNCTHLTC